MKKKIRLNSNEVKIINHYSSSVFFDGDKVLSTNSITENTQAVKPLEQSLNEFSTNLTDFKE